MDLKVKYIGLELSNPIIVGSSPFTASVENIIEMESHGAGAVVLKSIFEEQITNETAFLEGFNQDAQLADYLANYVGNEYIKSYLEMVSQAKRAVKIPIIASINCMESYKWLEYAKLIESAGADAIELNIFILPTNAKTDSQEVESKYLEIVAKVSDAVKIPITVKLGMRFTNILWLTQQMHNRGCKGVVFFNRFFEPDVDTKTLTMVSSNYLSNCSELRNSLRTTALCSSVVPMVDIAISTGVHCGQDVIKSLLVGAKAVHVCTAIYSHGLGIIEQMKCELSNWMETNTFQSIDEFSGYLSHKPFDNDDLQQRTQYMKFFPKQ